MSNIAFITGSVSHARAVSKINSLTGDGHNLTVIDSMNIEQEQLSDFDLIYVFRSINSAAEGVHIFAGIELGIPVLIDSTATQGHALRECKIASLTSFSADNSSGDIADIDFFDGTEFTRGGEIQFYASKNYVGYVLDSDLGVDVKPLVKFKDNSNISISAIAFKGDIGLDGYEFKADVAWCGFGQSQTGTATQASDDYVRLLISRIAIQEEEEDQSFKNSYSSLSSLDDIYILPVVNQGTLINGEGITNNNESEPLFLESLRFIFDGEKRTVTNEEMNLSIVIDRTQLGVLSVTENGSTKTAQCDDVVLYILDYRGQILLIDNSNNIYFKSYLFSYNDLYVFFELEPLESVGELRSPTEIEQNSFVLDGISYPTAVMMVKFNSNRLNKETIQESNQYNPQMTIFNGSSNAKTTSRNSGYSIEDFGSNKEKKGFIESSVSLDKSPSKNKKVILFTQKGNYLSETTSSEQGEYRFDNLFINQKYMVVAQYGVQDSVTPPDYSAVAADWQSPTPYGE